MNKFQHFVSPKDHMDVDFVRYLVETRNNSLDDVLNKNSSPRMTLQILAMIIDPMAILAFGCSVPLSIGLADYRFGDQVNWSVMNLLIGYFLFFCACGIFCGIVNRKGLRQPTADETAHRKAMIAQYCQAKLDELPKVEEQAKADWEKQASLFRSWIDAGAGPSQSTTA